MPKQPPLLPAHAPFYSPAATKARDLALEADPLSPLDLLLLGFGPGARAMSLAGKAGPRVATYAGAMARGARMAMTAGLVNDLSHGRNPGAAAPFNAAAGAAFGPPAELIAAAITGLGENVASRLAPRFRQGSYAEVLPGSAPLTESTPGALRPFSQALPPPATTRALPPAPAKLPQPSVFLRTVSNDEPWKQALAEKVAEAPDQGYGIHFDPRYMYFAHYDSELTQVPYGPALGSRFNGQRRTSIPPNELRHLIDTEPHNYAATELFYNPADAFQRLARYSDPNEVSVYKVPMPEMSDITTLNHLYGRGPLARPTTDIDPKAARNFVMYDNETNFAPLPDMRPVPAFPFLTPKDIRAKAEVAPKKRLTRVAQRGTPWRTMWLDMLAKGDRPYFHGTNSPVANFDPNFFSPGNLFGSGFYQTDSPRIAESYGRNVFLTKRTSRAPYINLERPFTPASALWQALNRSGILDIWDTHGKTPADVQKSIGGHDWMNGYAPTPTGRDVLDGFRGSERTKEYDAMLGQLAEFMATTNDGGRRYAGFTHLGGQYRGNREHNVRINWRPDLDLTMRPITLTGPDTPIPQHTYLSPAMQEYFDRNRTLASILYGVPINDLLPKRQPR